MERFKRWIEDHPLLAGSLVLLLIGVYFVVRKITGGSSTTNQLLPGTQVVSGGGPSPDATLAAQAAQNQTQAALSAQSQQLAAAIAAKQIDAATQLQIAQIQGNVATQGIVSQAQ